MSLSSSKQTTKSNQTTSGTTTPITPSWITQPIQGYTGKVTDFLNSDPSQYVVGPTALQTQAFNNASNLGGWQATANQATGIANHVASAAAPTATTHAYTAPNLGAAPTMQAAQVGAAPTMQAATLEAAPQAQAPTLQPYTATQAAQLSAAPQAQNTQLGATTLMQAANLGPAAQAGYVNLGSAPTMQAARLGPASQASNVNVGPTSNATAQQAQAGSILDNGGVQRYMDPGLQAYVNAAMADYDAQAGRQHASLEAQGAKAGAFGGSRFGVAEGDFASNSDRNRALLDAQLRSQAYGQAAGLAQGDQSNALQASLTNAGLGTQVSQGNAAAANARAAQQAGYDWDRIAANQNADNTFSLADASNRQAAAAANQGVAAQYGLTQGQLAQGTNLANLGAQQTYDLTGAGFQQQANATNAGAANANNALQGQLNQGTSLANLGLSGQFGLTQGQFDQGANAASAEAANTYGLHQGDLTQGTNLANLGVSSQYGLTGAELQQQANAANQAQAGQFGLAQAGYTQGANSANQQMAGQYGLSQAQLAAQAGQFNAAAANQTSQFNAQQQSQQYAQALQAAGIDANTANIMAQNSQGDVALQGQLGQQQYNIAQAQALAPLMQLQTAGQLYGQIPYNAFVGQQMNGTMTGTNMTKSSPSLMSMLAQMGQSAAQAYAGGAGG